MRLIIEIEAKPKGRANISIKIAAGSIIDNPGNTEYVDRESHSQAARVAWLTELSKEIQKTAEEFIQKSPSNSFRIERTSE